MKESSSVKKALSMDLAMISPTLYNALAPALALTPTLYRALALALVLAPTPTLVLALALTLAPAPVLLAAAVSPALVFALEPALVPALAQFLNLHQTATNANRTPRNSKTIETQTKKLSESRACAQVSSTTLYSMTLYSMKYW